ncbi:DNA-binding transcriptional regulator, LysR family [Dyella jiangningensis]|uniref:LysR family transcriptional regulator n=1 Tax=Dyella sp. AtDHG13 TaxID=1938897 RepID=UPI00087E4C19|nr:LysR family transcriptional regulator [Dyella sp. AtDHG13]PXV56145.1 LysR family transcriptional regulator [Dyella sp. AtDHG13]SDK73442.1 DNA-binding transcriptional regulator, LysR family [Dyella jiangningensis]
MNTRDVKAFMAVVDTGSIVQAAALLHLTQPGVTRRVQSLEALLGIELLDRQSKPLRPTAAGREIYQKGRDLLHAEASLLALARADTEPTGEFRLGVPPYLAERALAAPVDQLRARFPGLTLRIQAAWSPGLVEQVEQGLLDVSAVLLSESSPPPQGMITHAFDRQPIRIVAAPSLGLRGRVSLKDLSAFPWVLSQNGCGMRSTLRRAMEERGLPCNVGIEAFGADLQLSLVARGAGIGIVTPDLLAASPYRKQVRVLTITDFQLDMVAWLIHRALPPRLDAPVAVLLEQLKLITSQRPPSRRASDTG